MVLLLSAYSTLPLYKFWVIVIDGVRQGSQKNHARQFKISPVLVKPLPVIDQDTVISQKVSGGTGRAEPRKGRVEEAHAQEGGINKHVRQVWPSLPIRRAPLGGPLGYVPPRA